MKISVTTLLRIFGALVLIDRIPVLLFGSLTFVVCWTLFGIGITFSMPLNDRKKAEDERRSDNNDSVTTEVTDDTQDTAE